MRLIFAFIRIPTRSILNRDDSAPVLGWVERDEHVLKKMHPHRSEIAQIIHLQGMHFRSPSSEQRALIKGDARFESAPRTYLTRPRHRPRYGSWLIRFLEYYFYTIDKENFRSDELRWYAGTMARYDSIRETHCTWNQLFWGNRGSLLREDNDSHNLVTCRMLHSTTRRSIENLVQHN